MMLMKAIAASIGLCLMLNFSIAASFTKECNELFDITRLDNILFSTNDV